MRRKRRSSAARRLTSSASMPRSSGSRRSVRLHSAGGDRRGHSYRRRGTQKRPRTGAPPRRFQTSVRDYPPMLHRYIPDTSPAFLKYSASRSPTHCSRDSAGSRHPQNVIDPDPGPSGRQWLWSISATGRDQRLRASLGRLHEDPRPGTQPRRPSLSSHHAASNRSERRSRPQCAGSMVHGSRSPWDDSRVAPRIHSPPTGPP